MKILKTVVAAVLLFNGQFVFAHGEDKPGPHGGFIRMPGAFHTEIVPVAKNKLKVFLLDINWKNPTVLHSTIKVSFSGEKASEAKCKKEQEAFLCLFDESIDLKAPGKLLVDSTREKQRGVVVEYSTPLKF